MSTPPTKGTQYTAQWLVPKMNLWRSLAGLPRDLWLFSFATFINRLGTMAIPFLILYLTRELGFSAERAGSCLAFMALGPLSLLQSRGGSLTALEDSRSSEYRSLGPA